MENPHGQRSLMGYRLWGSQRDGEDWATKHTAQALYVFNLFYTDIWKNVLKFGFNIYSLIIIQMMPSHKIQLAFTLPCFPLSSRFGVELLIEWGRDDRKRERKKSMPWVLSGPSDNSHLHQCIWESPDTKWFTIACEIY